MVLHSTDFRQENRGAPFASKPAPTFDWCCSIERGLMWERACSRRGPQHFQKFQTLRSTQ
ncbi:hypothetical protein EAH78_29865 [Pseudomonas arsenicoxydans]|uniref:Uncharacterized protein n=1 Tax=Pseudomonas arsenicoxydans TaxID=702115 RepID=A0A502GX27_9PSED|nr:hypothetical protein EAH78_29865 [Pseudomonas arsenicoxydans]